MESFEDIQQKEFEHLTGEIGMLGRRLVELGWSREQVLDFVRDQSLSRWTPRRRTENDRAHLREKADRPIQRVERDCAPRPCTVNCA
jgi:hypothetical protein